MGRRDAWSYGLAGIELAALNSLGAPVDVRQRPDLAGQ